jgi:alcohol dehydrogenase (cytochrome c)
MFIRSAYCLFFLVSLLATQQSQSGQISAGDWPMHNRDHASTRFSQLSELTPGNVSQLRRVCSYPLPEDAEFESGLVAINGVLYFTTAEFTYAIDAATRQLKWRVRHHMRRAGGTVRGVAFAGGRLFRGFPDGSVIAYSASNGEEVWATKLKEPAGRDATISAAPVAWNGVVFI